MSSDFRLPPNVVKGFVKQVRDDKAKQPTLNGSEHFAVVKINKSTGEMTVRLDGSTMDTPASTAVAVRDKDRVKVVIKNHTATITENLTSNPLGVNELKDILNGALNDYVITNSSIIDSTFSNGLINGSTIQEATITGSSIKDSTIDGSKITNSTIDGSKLKDATIESAKIDYASFGKLEGDELKAASAAIDVLLSQSIRVGDITAEDGTIKVLKTEDLHAASGFIGDLTANNITANQAAIDILHSHQFLTDYAGIKFENVDQAYIKESWIYDLMVQGKLIAKQADIYYLDSVEINAGSITAGTMTADRLQLRGPDGLFYQINATTEGFDVTSIDQEVAENAMHGDNIIAKTITADKIDVADLTALGATIGGWHIDEDSIWSGSKDEFEKADTLGAYLGASGQFDLGTDNEYLRFDPVTGQLDIQSGHIKLSATESLADRLGSLSSSIEQTADRISIAFESTGTLEGDWNEFKTYFLLGNLGKNASGQTIEGVEIGKRNDDNQKFRARIMNQGIAFIDDSSLTAYIANNSMYASNITIMDDLRFNDFLWDRRPNGNLSLRHLTITDANKDVLGIPVEIYDMFGVTPTSTAAGRKPFGPSPTLAPSRTLAPRKS